MNTKMLALLLIPISLNCFPLSWFSKSQQQAQPKVMVIEMYDPINFKECGAQLFRATKETNVAGVILMVNSWGGEDGNFSVIHDMVKKLTETKPVVCLIMGSACSGGYMAASAATVILAHTLSAVGSIGVYADIDRYQNAHIKNARIKDEIVKADLKVEVVRAGEFKGLTNPYLPELTESQRSFIQAQLMREYGDFINLVAQNRNLKKENYKVWAEGKRFDAVEALELGLIDGIGTIFHAEEMIKGLVLERNPQFGQPDAIEIVYPKS